MKGSLFLFFQKDKHVLPESQRDSKAIRGFGYAYWIPLELPAGNSGKTPLVTPSNDGVWPIYLRTPLSASLQRGDNYEDLMTVLPARLRFGRFHAIFPAFFFAFTRMTSKVMPLK